MLYLMLYGFVTIFISNLVLFYYLRSMNRHIKILAFNVLADESVLDALFVKNTKFQKLVVPAAADSLKDRAMQSTVAYGLSNDTMKAIVTPKAYAYSALLSEMERILEKLDKIEKDLTVTTGKDITTNRAAIPKRKSGIRSNSRPLVSIPRDDRLNPRG